MRLFQTFETASSLHHNGDIEMVLSLKTSFLNYKSYWTKINVILFRYSTKCKME